MEPDESGLNSYYHHHHPQPSLHHNSSAATALVSSPPRNGILLNVDRSTVPHQMAVYSQSPVPSAISPPVVEPVRRKRGRPRKYGTPEQAAAAKRLSSSLSGTMSLSSPKKRELTLVGASSSSSYSKKTQYPGNTSQGFTPHIITVAAGEDIYEKVIMFMQLSKRVICILSASGSVSNPSFRQPATSGGNITYEVNWVFKLTGLVIALTVSSLLKGQFEILSMSGSYIHSEIGGRTGGLTVSLSSTDGQIIGGCINGPIRAAGPVMVFVGTFLSEMKKDMGHVHGVKSHDHSSGQTPSATPFGGHIFLGSGFD